MPFTVHCSLYNVCYIQYPRHIKDIWFLYLHRQEKDVWLTTDFYRTKLEWESYTHLLPHVVNSILYGAEFFFIWWIIFLLLLLLLLRCPAILILFSQQTLSAVHTHYMMGFIVGRFYSHFVYASISHKDLLLLLMLLDGCHRWFFVVNSEYFVCWLGRGF